MNDKCAVDLPKEVLCRVYRRLSAYHGHLGWWPGDSRFEIMVGAVLTQNAAWANVEKAIANLKEAGVLSLDGILSAEQVRLAQWLRPSGYFNLKAQRLRNLCVWLKNLGGEQALVDIETDTLRRSLLAVNGIGPETADDILLYAFERPVFVIDAYTRRIFSRLGLIQGKEHHEQLRLGFQQSLGEDVALFNDYHAQIVYLAKDICRPKPRCDQCPLQSECSWKGMQQSRA